MRTALAASYEPSICASATPSDKGFTQKTPQWAEDIRKSFTFPARLWHEHGTVAEDRSLPRFFSVSETSLVFRVPTKTRNPSVKVSVCYQDSPLLV